MNIFLSYRRGKIDTLFANTLFGHLHGRGFEVFFDQDDLSNPIGKQFPETATSK